MSAERYGESMDAFTLSNVFTVVLWLLGVIVTLWILWAIIRSAVLSALRAHSHEGGYKR